MRFAKRSGKEMAGAELMFPGFFLEFYKVKRWMSDPGAI